jgi:hypothetical protein
MLITEWPTLQRWLEDSQAMRGFMAELRQAAKQWMSRNKPNDLVWRGATAEEALGHVKRQLLDLSAIEREFIEAVRKQAARGRRRKVLVFTTVFTALGLVLAGGSFALVKIKMAESEAKDRATEAVKALSDAQTARKQAETDRAAAVSAKADLQKQFDIIAEKERLRAEAEQKASQAQAGEELSKEQLAEANKALVGKVAEAVAAKEKAIASEAAAKKATDEAKAAKVQVQRMLEAKQAEVEKLKKQAADISTRGL